MRILLVRHGRPEGVGAAPISGRALGEWVRSYDAAGISAAVTPPPRLRLLASAAKSFIASDLARARESAASLAEGRDIALDSDLREAALANALGTSLKLPPGAWIVIARLAWFLNVGDASESIAATRVRAARMADRLAALAAEHDCVMAVGHGMFNRFLATELRRREWRGPRILPRRYWGIAEFTLETPLRRG